MGIKLTATSKTVYETNAGASRWDQFDEALGALNTLPTEAIGHHPGEGMGGVGHPSDFLFEIVQPEPGMLHRRDAFNQIAIEDGSGPTYIFDGTEEAAHWLRRTMGVQDETQAHAPAKPAPAADLLEEELSADHPIVATLYVPLESIRLNVHAPTLAEGMATLGQLTYDDLPDYVEHNGRTFHIAYDDNEPFEVVLEDEKGEWPDGKDDDNTFHRGRMFGTFEAIAAAATAPPPPPPTFQPGQRVTVARIEGTSEGDVPGPFSGVVIERMDTPCASYSVLVLRHDRPRRGLGGFHAGEYEIDEADLSPA